MHPAARILFALLFVLPFFSTSAFAQTEIVTLESGKPIECELKRGEVQSYKIALFSGQFLYVTADQRGIDVTVALFSPDGKKLIEVDSLNGTRGIEPLWMISETNGDYRLEISSFETASPSGKYAVKIVELRNALPNDKILIKASQNMWEANLLKRQDSADSIVKAVEKYKEASDLFQQISDTKKQADSLAKIGEIYLLNYKADLAIKYCEQALKIYETLDSKRDIALMNAWLGEAHNDKRDFLKAIDYFQTALSSSISLNEKSLIGEIGINMGLAQQELGNFDEAFKYYFKSLALAKEVKATTAIAAILNNIGIIYTIQGNYARALETQQKQLDIIKSSNKENLLPRTLLNIGAIHFDQGNYAVALDYYEKALQSSEKMKDAEIMSGILNNIGVLYLDRSKPETALNYFEKSLQIKNEIGIIDYEIYENFGEVYRLQGNYDKALEHFQKSLDVSDGRSLTAMINIAKTYTDKEEYKKTIDFSTRVTESARRMRALKSLALAYFFSGRAKFLMGDIENARQDLNASISTIETLRLYSIGDVESKSRFFEQNLSPYFLMVKLAVSENKLDEAFTFAEGSKSRVLLDVLQNGKIDLTEAMTAQEKMQERLLKNAMISLNAQISVEIEQQSPDQSRLADLQNQLNKKRLEFEDFQTRLYAAHPELRVQRAEMKPVSLEESAALLTNDKSALLEYVVADDKTFLFVLTKNASQKISLKVYPLAIKQKDLAERTESFRARLAKGDLDFSRQSQDLYNLLLKPAEAQLKNKTNLIIVPDSALWDLPFQALQTANSKYLVESAAVSYAPSLTALREMVKKNKGKNFTDATILAFGNPTIGKETSDRIKQVFMSESLEPLPEAERLVTGLGKLYGAQKSKIFIGAEAREETAKTESSKYRIVQFAAHGILNDVSPMYSHIVLAQKQDNPNEDGLLEAWEMKDLDLNADLVILSACETARGKLSSGEGVIGMSWALFIAGAPTTVASQWKVESSSTTELMLEFHRQLLTTKNISKAEALRRASLKLMKMPQYKHPSYWAGFVMVGDGF